MRKLLLATFLSFTLLSISSKSEAQVLINYWNFNNFTATDTFGSAKNPIPLIDADYSSISTTDAYMLYTFDAGTSVKSEDSCWIDGTTGSTVNAQQAAPAGNCLRVRNPSDFTALEFFIPTTNFKNISVSYALQSSSAKSGQAVEAFAYSVDSGVTWKTASLTVNGVNVDTLLDTAAVYISGFGLVTIGFGSDTTVNNNTKLVLRITFKTYGTGAVSGTSGNARLDNIAVTGSYLVSAIIVSTPPAGDTLYVGQQIPIIYQVFGGVSSIRTVNLSTDSGRTWTELGLSTMDTFQWVVPNKASSNCFIEVYDTINGIIGKSPRFVIHAPKIVVSTPPLSDTLYAGLSDTISYQTFGFVSPVRTVNLSTDSGYTWTELGTSSTNSFVWVVPNHGSSNCFIEVIDTTNIIVGESPRFVIHAPKIVVSAPPAGTTLIVGQSDTIIYQTFGLVTNFRAIYLSTDSGKTWTEQGISTKDTFVWAVSNDTSSNCYIEIQDGNGAIGKTGKFAILYSKPIPPPPTGGLIQYWNFNNLATTTTYKVPNVPHIDADFSALDTSKAYLEYYLEPGTSSSYGSANGSDNLDGVASADTSNLRLGAPSGDALRFRNPVDSIELRWHIPSTGYNNLVVKFAVESSSIASGDSTQLFSYSVDGGATWKATGMTVNGANVDTLLVANPDSAYLGTRWGLVTVTFGNDLTVNNNPNLIFRIVFRGNTHLLSGNNRIDDFTLDGSQGAPPPPVKDSIAVSAPATGDTLLAGTQTTIAYSVTATTSPTRSIDYSTDGGSTWTNIATGVTALTYSWTIPTKPTSNAIIRVKDSIGVIGLSSKFVIVVPGTVASVSLSGSQVIAGTATNIDWSASGYLGNTLNIDVAYDGQTWNPIVAGYVFGENTSYSWTAPKIPFTGVLIRVTFASGATATSVPFDIVSPAEVAAGTNPKAMIELWPNPATNELNYISKASSSSTITIFDVTGNSVLFEKANAVRVLDISSLAGGVYYVRITDSETGQVSTSSFVKE